MARNGAFLNHDAMTSVAAHAPLFVPAPDVRATGRPANSGSVPGARFAASRYLGQWIGEQTGSVINLADIAARDISLPEASCATLIHDAPLTADTFDDTVASLARAMRQDGTAVLAVELGHNPFSRRNRTRRLTGTSPASFQVRVPPTCRHIDSLRASFGLVDVHAFDLLTVPLARIETALVTIHPGLGKLTAPIWPVLRSADRYLLRWRPLRRYAGQVVVILKWPRRPMHG